MWKKVKFINNKVKQNKINNEYMLSASPEIKQKMMN